MQYDSNPSNIIRNGILFIHAYNVQIRVSENQLLIDYRNPIKGEKARKTSLRLNRATSGLKRLIISGDDGYISLAALRWLAEIKASVMQIGFDNQLFLASTPPGNDTPSLRRHQVLAGSSPIGVEIVRELLFAKIRGQIDIMEKLGENPQPLETALGNIRESGDPQEMMGYEGKASADYWLAWSNVPLHFAGRDQKSLPDHWGRFRKRMSDLGLRPRKATNPANAMLNYLYAILKGETTTALQSVGLDPGLGFLHSDNPYTPNLSLDVMEAARPSLDARFLAFLDERIFTRKEFFEMTDGSVRLGGPLRQELSQFGSIAFSLVAPWAEYIVHALQNGFERKVTYGTPLTQQKRKLGRKKNPAKSTNSIHFPKTEKRCPRCGNVVTGKNRYCQDCFPETRPELTAHFSRSGIRRLQELRDQGESPNYGGEAARKRGETQKIRIAARKAWETAHPGRLEVEIDRYIREIQPLLVGFSIRELARICGCSFPYAARIRNGDQVPHPVFYEALEKAIPPKRDTNPVVDRTDP